MKVANTRLFKQSDIVAAVGVESVNEYSSLPADSGGKVGLSNRDGKNSNQNRTTSEPQHRHQNNTTRPCHAWSDVPKQNRLSRCQAVALETSAFHPVRKTQSRGIPHLP